MSRDYNPGAAEDLAYLEDEDEADPTDEAEADTDEP